MLPLDVLENIFDIVGESHADGYNSIFPHNAIYSGKPYIPEIWLQTLKSSSLVDKQWNHSAQRHLVRLLVLDWRFRTSMGKHFLDDLPKTLSFRGSGKGSALSPTSITIVKGTPWSSGTIFICDAIRDNILVEYLKSWKLLKSLSIRWSADGEDVLPPHFGCMCVCGTSTPSTPLQSITNLSLDFKGLPDSEVDAKCIMAFFIGLPELKELSLNSISKLSGWNEEFAVGLIPSFHLQKMSLSIHNNTWMKKFIKWIFSNSTNTLQTLTVHTEQLMDIDWVDRYLSEMNHELTKLAVYITTLMFDPTALHSLLDRFHDVLELGLNNSVLRPSWSNLFDQSALRQLRLFFSGTVEDANTLLSLSDLVVSRSATIINGGFPALTHLTLDIDGVGSSSHWIDDIKAFATSCTEANIDLIVLVAGQPVCLDCNDLLNTAGSSFRSQIK